jgi:nucleoside-diphosphate-sugar epimerase
VSKAQRELGYAPEVGLAEGLRRTGEWYRNMGLLPGAPGTEQA